MADLHMERSEGFGLATIMARRDVGVEAIGAVLGIDPPTRPAWSRAPDGLMLIGSGAGAWLAHADDAPPLWAEILRERLGGNASVSDQSDGYAIFRLAGEGARTVLQRGAAIDLHPVMFGPGSAVTTVIAHIGAIVWQVDDRPTYDVAVFRSYSESFHHWLGQMRAAL